MLVIGAVFVDVKGFSREKYVPTGTNIGDVNIVHGGVCRNVAENFAKLSEPVRFVSMVEDTGMGREVLERLQGLGVNVDHVIRAENGMGMWLAILDERGNLAGSISRQPDFSALEDYVHRRADDIIAGCADDIVLEFDMNERIAAHVLACARRHGRRVYSIVGNMGVIMRHPEYLEQVACFICNEVEASRLFGSSLAGREAGDMLEALRRESLRAGIRAMVVTMGERGAAYVDHETGEAGHCPAIPVRMVDSTGAGDAFFTGATAALSRGYALSQAVEVGSRLAAMTLQVAESCCPPAANLMTWAARHRRAGADGTV